MTIAGFNPHRITYDGPNDSKRAITCPMDNVTRALEKRHKRRVRCSDQSNTSRNVGDDNVVTCNIISHGGVCASDAS